MPRRKNRCNFLCSIISNVCSNRRDTPLALQEAYDQLNYGQQKPALSSFKHLLRTVLSGFDCVFLVIDALDECPKSKNQRCELLSLLHEIRNLNETSLRLLATSRKESDIIDLFTPPTISNNRDYSRCIEVSIQGVHIEEDLEKYLGSRLRDSRFSSWSNTFKEHVRKILSSLPSGMLVLKPTFIFS